MGKIRKNPCLRLFSYVGLNCILALVSSSAVSAILTAEDVSRSVLENFPLIEKAEFDLRAAEGTELASRGAFDTKIKIKSANRFDDKYDYRDLETSVEKQLPFSGLKVYAGHHLGRGDIPPYTGKYETAPRGEAFVGARLPLLRNRAIDEMRFGQIEASFQKAVAENELLYRKNYYVFKALATYQKWALAQRKVNVKKALLDIATDRQKMLDRQSKLGDVERIAVTDGRRSVLKRQAEVVEAENELQNAKAEMALYLRNDDGSPRSVETLEPKLETQALRKAKTFELDKKRLPQITSLQTQRDLQNAASEFGKNQRLPILEVDATQFQTLPRRGEPDTTRFQLGVFLEIPLENRSGRGKETAALAKRDSVERQLIYLEAELKARLAQAAATMTASEKRLELLNEELRSANIVANAERRRWRSGDSNLFLVAAREEEAANVEIRLWSADYDFVIAEAEAKFLTNTLF